MFYILYLISSKVYYLAALATDCKRNRKREEDWKYRRHAFPLVQYYLNFTGQRGIGLIPDSPVKH